MCSITSNDRPFCCPIIYINRIHNAILFIDTSTMLDTMFNAHQLMETLGLTIIASNEYPFLLMTAFAKMSAWTDPEAFQFETRINFESFNAFHILFHFNYNCRIIVKLFIHKSHNTSVKKLVDNWDHVLAQNNFSTQLQKARLTTSIFDFFRFVMIGLIRWLQSMI